MTRFAPPGADRLGLSADPLAASGPVTVQAPAPAPIANFEGLSDDDNAATIGGRIVPPDTEGDVGPNHYVQMINLIFAVYDKNGNIVPGGEPRAGSDIWQGFGGICETNNDGDPIILYDHLADRWMFSQFAFFDSMFRGHQCIAVSTTPDPTGPYHRYDFLVSPGSFNFPDYPKLGLWEDGYYMTANEFNGLFGFNGAIAVAFERDEMLLGNAAQMVLFGPLPCDAECFFSLQPSHLEGPAPPAGTPNTFVMAFDDQTWGTGGNPDGYRLWDFSVDWVSPASSTFTPLGQVDTTAFDANLCGFGPCVPQLDSTELLDTLSQFTMFRAQAREFGTHQSLTVSHTVDLGGDRAGVRWSELRNSGGGWFLQKTGTIGPADGLHRWMGSAAMDSAGNIAVGYSVSSAGIYPEIRYTVIDSAGTPTDEGLLLAGTGSQAASSNRWGDYSSMSVDPVDDCTFWYTQEYYQDPGASFDFKTRIGSFQAAGCTGGEPVCGNGIVEAGEDCDSTVCCAADCTFAGVGTSCEGTFFCQNGETCDGAGACGGGTPLDCSDGISCTDDSCDEGADTCVNSANNANCDNGIFCDGAEVCDPTLDCQAGTPIDCNDGVGCTVDSCNEGSNSCDNVPDDTFCPDDGLFCNGMEFCDPTLDCSSTGDPCAPGQSCNETTDVCEDVCKPKKASCTADNECCSGKCRGKTGSMTCK